ncbi:hypothetical protein ACHAXA_007085 [Cyclostephanos tholiformis]|uniref:Uncharacterized protein n=1 Tax=Cyclostephanos tholiformis TaxID=382380 RepID=A0ABD3RZ70_9STRA
MNEDTNAKEATPPTHTKKSHYQLSKKVAQLIKVIVQLNTVNENYSAEKKRLMDALGRECKAVKDDAEVRLNLLQDEVIRLQEIKHAKNEADEKLKTLQEEVHVMREVIAKHAEREKESYELLATIKRDVKYEANEKLKTLQEEVHTMRELISKHEEREKESRELLATVKRDAKAEVEKLKRNQEHEMMSQAQIVNDISRSLEEQSRQHQANILRLRSDLAGEHKQLAENLREEISSSHADEILLLKSRHEKNVMRVKSEALEQEKLAVDAAVAKIRQEYEEMLCRQLSSCVKKSEEMKAEAINMVRREMDLLEEELERVKLRADEIPILKEKLDNYNCNETKLQLEVARLQNCLNSVSTTNQSVILELRTQNTELCDHLQVSREAGENQLERIECLEIENNELKALLNKLDMQKSSLESEIKAEHRLLDNERQLSLSQLDECKSIIRSLQEDVDVAMTSNIGMVAQLSVTTAELGKYKHFVQRTLAPLLQIVKRDAHEAKSDIVELSQLFSVHLGDFAKWKQRLTSVRANETTKFLEREQVLQDQNNKLRIAVETHKVSLIEATNLRCCLEKKVELAAETARNVVESARVELMGERLSWERALEDTKESARIERERICCRSREEADNLKATLKVQTESHDHKLEIMVADRQQKLIEIQGLSRELAELNATLASKECDVVTLVNTIDSLRAQQIEQERIRHQELEVLSVRHQNELDKSNRLNEQLRREYDETLRSECEKATESAISKKRIDELNRCIAAERSKMIIELTKMNNQLDNLRSHAIESIDNIKQEWNIFCERVISVKLKSIKQAYDATCHDQNQEIEQLRTAAMSFERRLTAGEKDAQDAKTMLFNTIRESETKLARALRHLSEEHKLEIEALVKASKRECESITAKLEQKSKECEFHLSVTAEKDLAMAQLKKKLADAIRSLEEENRAMALQHDTDRLKLMTESNGKVASMMEDFAKEKSKILSELQTQINAVKEKLQAANDRWNSRPSLQRDLDEIKSL